MYRSFLAMTGANTGLRGDRLPPEAGNGLLSAQDITALDLWNTDLVVLCACQTGMGDIKTGEGVFGLRRALAIAGAKTLIMSLWSVPALPTVLLMDRLFDTLEQQSPKDYRAALEIAQDYIQTITVAELNQSQLGQDILKELTQVNLLNGKPDQQPLQHPHFWAAWICQGL
jgi:CHAT domain-containing protein